MVAGSLAVGDSGENRASSETGPGGERERLAEAGSVAALGEVMLELRPVPGEKEQYGLAFAGDTFNTAVGLARLGVKTGYITMLGEDAFSDRIMAAGEQEGLNMSAVFRTDKATPGLYLIENDERGERQFHYWRDSSAARELLADSRRLHQVLEALRPYDVVYFSGITAAVMGLSAEEPFIALVEALRQQGKKLLFDPNYRPRLWPNAKTAARWTERIAGQCTCVFPTLADETQLWGCAGEEDAIRHYLDLGIEEVVLKCPGAVAVAGRGEERCRVSSPYEGPVVDTTGAGDAFNAGYIAARLRGQPLNEALIAAHEAAAQVVSVKGALAPRGHP